MAIRLDDVDFDRCQIRVNEGKGRKDRVVPFPSPFKETLALHADRLRQKGASYLFESSWKKPYSDRGVRRLLERYATTAGLAEKAGYRRRAHPASRKALEIYSHLAIGEAQLAYDVVCRGSPSSRTRRYFALGGANLNTTPATGSSGSRYRIRITGAGWAV